MHKVITIEEVMMFTTLSRATIYRGVKDGAFPKPVKLSSKRVGWIESEVEAWLERRRAGECSAV